MTASPNDLTALDAAAKQLYKDGNFEELVYKTRPLLGMLPKVDWFGGRNMPVVFLFGNPQGVSATFSTAQGASVIAAAGKLQVSDVLLTRKKSYQVFTIDGETIEALTGDETSFIVAMKAVIDGAIRALSDELETSLFRAQQGSITVTTSVGAGGSAALNYFGVAPDESPLFEVGMGLVAASDAIGTTLLNTSKVLYVIKVDRGQGFVYTGDSTGTTANLVDNSAGWTTGFTTGYFVFRAGDMITGGTSVLKFSGLADWLPSTISQTDSFYSINRSSDSRLWGIPVDGSTLATEEALIDSNSIVCREGGNPDVAIVNPFQYRRALKQLGAKRVYVDVAASDKEGILANIAFKGIVLDGDKGPMTLISANKCPKAVGYTMTMSTWLLATLGPTVHFTQYDGLRILRQASDDGVEGRLVSRGNLANRAPIWSGRIALPA